MATLIARRSRRRFQGSKLVDQQKLKQLSHLDLLIEDFQQQECSDVRDYVFGLLGLVNDPCDPNFGLRADYSKTPAEIHTLVIQNLKRGTREHPYGDWLARFSGLLVGLLRL
jgi:hypothetical protein